jgi:cation:H+ antiporter
VIIAILMCLGGLIGLVLGGEWLVRGAVSLATRLGVSSLFTGLVIVGIGTSMPELATSIEAVMAGSPGIAWGNIAGSNIANTLLILGAAALIQPIALNRADTLRDAVVGVAASVVLFVIAWFVLGSVWIGLALLVAIVGYIVWRYSQSRQLGVEVITEEDLPVSPNLTPIASGGLLVVGLGVMVIGASYLVSGAVDLARLFGMSETVIGLTIVAVGTSLPELTASAIAAWRGHSDLAIGNVLGSNIFNILLIGGVTMTVSPGAIPAEMIDVELPIVIASALLVTGFIAFRKQIGRKTGAVLVALFSLNTAFLLVG